MTRKSHSRFTLLKSLHRVGVLQSTALPSIESLTFDATGMALVTDKSTMYQRLWVTPEPDGVILNFYPVAPDIPAGLDQIDALRFGYRQRAADRGSAFIRVEVVEADGCPAILLITRFHLESRAAVYVASLTLPFRDFSFGLRAQCQEYGLTGVREAVIFAETMGSEQIGIKPEREERGGGGIQMLATEDLVGWVIEPNGPNPRTEPPGNISEDESTTPNFQTIRSRGRAV